MKLITQIIGNMVGFFGQPFIYLMLAGSKRARIAVRCGDDILLVRVLLSGRYWMLPGGGMKSGEQPSAAVLRELAEETGITIKPQQLIHHGQHRSVPTFGTTYSYDLYSVSLTKKPKLILKTHEISEAEWVPIDNVRRMYHLEKTTAAIFEMLDKPVLNQKPKNGTI